MPPCCCSARDAGCAAATELLQCADERLTGAPIAAAVLRRLSCATVAPLYDVIIAMASTRAAMEEVEALRAEAAALRTALEAEAAARRRAEQLRWEERTGRCRAEKVR